MPSVRRIHAAQQAIATFEYEWRSARMNKPDIWYVSFGADKSLKNSDGVAGPARTTRTFKTESDARLFALEIVRKGWSASAGTINPHQPKQLIAPSDVEMWADGGG